MKLKATLIIKQIRPPQRLPRALTPGFVRQKGWSRPGPQNREHAAPLKVAFKVQVQVSVAVPLSVPLSVATS